MRTFSAFNKSLFGSASIFAALFLTPCTGMAQYAAAQTLRLAEAENSKIAGAIGQFCFDATLCFLCAMGVLVLGFIVYMVKSFADLSKRNTQLRQIVILALALGLSALGSSCSPAQKARAEQYRVAMEAEQRLCPMEHHYHGADDWINNAYAYHNTSVWYGPTFCKQCGQRITPNH